MYSNKQFFLLLSNHGLEANNKTFCVYCLKSYKNIKQHFCKRMKCPLCFRFNFENEYDNSFCSSNQKDVLIQCKNCEKISTNQECADIHGRLKPSDCKLVKICKKCGQYFRLNSLSV